MSEAERMMLEDAMITAIESEKKCIKQKRLIVLLSALLGAAVVAIVILLIVR